jgi:hypothetical protein
MSRYLKPRESDKNELTNKLEIESMQPSLLKKSPRSTPTPTPTILAKCCEKLYWLMIIPLQNPQFYYL